MTSHVASCGLVLAAGKGTRMKSDRCPKVMRRLLDEPMLAYVYAALEPVVGSAVHTVVGYGAETVRQAFPHRADRMILQAEQKGTGHALQVAWPQLKAEGRLGCLVVNGDTPLMTAAQVDAVLRQAAGADLAFATIVRPLPNSYGRVVRHAGGEVAAIVEAKDYEETRFGPPTGEVNAGVYWLRLEAVEPLLASLNAQNKSGEVYITDLVGLAVDAGLRVKGVACGDAPELMGVDTPLALAEAEERLRGDLVAHWLARGVIIRQGSSVRLGPNVRIAPGAEITGPCELYGATTVEEGAIIASHCLLRDVSVAPGAEIRSFSHLEQAVVGSDCVVGPYARLRPGAVLEIGSRVGNFVEMKKSRLGPGAKASHLTYLGDADIGAEANIGAGTITCNYDGKRKHRTVIGPGAFIGSNTALVAPVSVGEGALVGAGSTITKNVEPGNLAVARARQVQFPRK